MLQTSDLDYLRSFAEEHAGIVLGEDKTVEARLRPVADTHGLQSLAALVAAIRESEGAGILRRNALDALANGETLFFRDRHPFDALASAVLPELIRVRQEKRQLSIWSAGCSTGQEPYSLAMLIREKFPELASWQVTILGTDVSERAIAKARTGAYTQIEVNQGLPATYLVKFFCQGKDEHWLLRSAIREMVRLERRNLLQPGEETQPFDLVLFRNVLTHFGEHARREVCRRMALQLMPDGYLVLGAAEGPLLPAGSFESRRIGRADFFQPAGVPA